MLRPYNSVRILRRHDPPLPPHGRAALVQDDVDDQPMQPGAERALAPKRAQLVPQPHENILGALLGVAPIAGETETEGIDSGRVLAIQLPKCGLVASLGTGDKIVGHGIKTPSSAAAFGREPSRQPHAAEQLPQPLLEILLELVDPPALLCDLLL